MTDTETIAAMDSQKIEQLLAHLRRYAPQKTTIIKLASDELKRRLQ